MLTERGSMLLGAMRRNLELLAELDKTAPGDVNLIVSHLASHLRNWKPMSLVSMETGPMEKVDL